MVVFQNWSLIIHQTPKSIQDFYTILFIVNWKLNCIYVKNNYIDDNFRLPKVYEHYYYNIMDIVMVFLLVVINVVLKLEIYTFHLNQSQELVVIRISRNLLQL